MAFKKGNRKNNNLIGTNNSDELKGLRGRDTLTGLGGSDQLYGGKGRDVLYGGRGNDFLYGGAGSDRLDGYGGDSREIDNLHGGSGGDTFVIGTSSSSYYNKSGKNDYAFIEGFNPSEDVIMGVGGKVDSNNSNYDIATEYLSTPLGTAVRTSIFYQGDLVAYVPYVNGL